VAFSDHTFSANYITCNKCVVTRQRYVEVITVQLVDNFEALINLRSHKYRSCVKAAQRVRTKLPLWSGTMERTATTKSTVRHWQSASTMDDAS